MSLRQPVRRDVAAEITDLIIRKIEEGVPVPPHLADEPAALRAYHATLYPAILNAEIIDAGVSGAAHVMEYRRAVGTKG